MTSPPLLALATPALYRAHFEEHLCSLPLRTSNGTPVYVRKAAFSHAFYERSNWAGEKDRFAVGRAERMMWIRDTLLAGDATRWQGWNSAKEVPDPRRCVFNAFDHFVVVVQVSRKVDGSLKGDFITCYDADAKGWAKLIRSQPWTHAAFRSTEAWQGNGR